VSIVREKILIPVDGSKTAFEVLEYGVELAEKLDSEVVVVYVVEPFSKSPTLLAQFKAEMVHQTEELLENVGNVIIKHVQDKFADTGIPLECEIRDGNAAEQILLAAEEWGCSMIVIGNRGLGTVAEFLLGSVSQKVSSHAKIPVLIVKNA